MSTSDREGATRSDMLKLIGRISREDAEDLIRIIDECCRQIDEEMWLDSPEPVLIKQKF
jgi:hypothetical protein